MLSLMLSQKAAAYTKKKLVVLKQNNKYNLLHLFNYTLVALIKPTEFKPQKTICSHRVALQNN